MAKRKTTPCTEKEKAARKQILVDNFRQIINAIRTELDYTPEQINVACNLILSQEVDTSLAPKGR